MRRTRAVGTAVGVAIVCALSFAASACEYASEAIVLTRMQSTTPPGDAAADQSGSSDDASAAGWLSAEAAPQEVRDAGDGRDAGDARGADAAAEAAVDTFAVPPARMLLLDRGFEVQDWMGTQYNRNLFSATELRTLKGTGFRNLRIAFGMPLLFDDNAPGVLKPGGLANYDEILDQVLAAGLAVVIHPFAQTIARDWSDLAYVGKMQAFWQAFAAHLVERARDPERVFLKIEYDPKAASAATWYAAQPLLVEAVRKVDPERTLLLTPNALTLDGDSNTIQAVQEIPIGPRNVVYDFGFFAPAPFTHQGANWREPWMEDLHGLPYPSSPAACAPILPTIVPASRPIAQEYCAAQYNAASIDGLISPASTWAKSKNVQLINGAFGVYKAQAPTAGRLAWLRDVRSVFEARGIPWAYYDDSPAFSLMTGTAGRRIVDPPVAEALGLTGSP